MTSERNDPVLDEIRAIRQKISDRFGNDPASLVAYYMDLQLEHRERLRDFSRGSLETEGAATVSRLVIAEIKES